MATRFFVLLTLLVLTSCQKSLETSVKGRVLTYGTNDKAANKELNVNLYAETGGSGIFDPGETLVEEGRTDANGNFSFSFTAERKDIRYYLRIMEGAPMHHTPSYSSSIYFINVGEHQTQNIYLSPHAWLKLHIENVNPQPGDRITISWGGGVTKTFHGGVNEASVFFGGGNFNRSIPFELYRNGEWIRWRDTVWMNAFDTVYHKVEY